jgi:hypothetical protein
MWVRTSSRNKADGKIQHQMDALYLTVAMDGIKVVREYAGRGISGKIGMIEKSPEWLACRRHAMEKNLPILIVNPSRALRHNKHNAITNPDDMPSEDHWSVHKGVELVSLQNPTSSNESQKQFLARLAEEVKRVQSKGNIQALVSQCRQEGLSSRKTAAKVFKETRKRISHVSVTKIWNKGDSVVQFQPFKPIQESAERVNSCSDLTGQGLMSKKQDSCPMAVWERRRDRRYSRREWARKEERRMQSIERLRKAAS